ncbi:hypothetical protein WK39_20025 [Burkholderia cepacia]|nr:hypothetical protein WK40_30980 [Burkholderia cepacia]KVS56733.1 hypothetical protein WK39_20025 [Burkholderia cepacia]RRA04182.1 hypothetical protein DF055_14280 [Burkholderia cepacia]RRA08091.1 hypothetical protein DF054_16260 [Burkholderia cepacia]
MILVVLRVIRGGLLSAERVVMLSGMKSGQMELNSELSSIQMSIHFLIQSSSLIGRHLFGTLLR